MRKLLLIMLLLAATFVASVPGHAAPVATPRSGQLARGHIEPVPPGDLYVSVYEMLLQPGQTGRVAGVAAFLVTMSNTVTIEDGGTPKLLPEGEAVFTAGTPAIVVSNKSDAPAMYRVIGMGGQTALPGARFVSEPLPWGPASAYDVTLDRGEFGAGGATPWHYHTGPAFGVLEGGTWENRQADGPVTRIPAPGYYLQPHDRVHQLAQVGTGGYAHIVQFFPPGQPQTGGGPGLPDGQAPGPIQVATAVPPQLQTPAPIVPTLPATTPPTLLPTLSAPTLPATLPPTIPSAPSAAPTLALATATPVASAPTVPASSTPTTLPPTPSAPSSGGDLGGLAGLALAAVALAGLGVWWARRR